MFVWFSTKIHFDLAKHATNEQLLVSFDWNLFSELYIFISGYLCYNNGIQITN
jgi:hypothetical protein